MATVDSDINNDHPMRRVTRQVAYEDGWSPGRAQKVADLFDSMAAEWDEARSGLQRTAPIRDAMARGSMNLGGHWLEIGAGTGVGTRTMAPVMVAEGGRLVAADLAMQMLLHSPERAAPLVRADASVLPFVDNTFDGVALINMLLFPEEVDRIVGPGGQVLWVNTSGDRTPIHLSPEDFLTALPGDWSAAWANSGTGFWVVATRR